MTESAPVLGYPSGNQSWTFSPLLGGSWQDRYPIINILNDNMKIVARSTDATTASTQIHFTDNGALSYIGAFALIKTNLTLSATVRFRIWSSGVPTYYVDTGTISAFPNGERGDGSMYYWFGREWGARGISIEITDTANPDGYVEITFLQISRAVQLSHNFVPGAGRGRSYRTTSSQIAGGKKIFGRRPSYKTFKGVYRLTDADLYSNVFDLWRFGDKDVPFLLFTKPDDPTNYARHTFFCRNKNNDGTATMIAQDLNEVQFNIKETL